MGHSGNAVLATILTKFKRAVRTVELMRRVGGPEETEERGLDKKEDERIYGKGGGSKPSADTLCATGQIVAGRTRLIEAAQSNYSINWSSTER